MSGQARNEVLAVLAAAKAYVAATDDAERIRLLDELSISETALDASVVIAMCVAWLRANPTQSEIERALVRAIGGKGYLEIDFCA